MDKKPSKTEPAKAIWLTVRISPELDRKLRRRAKARKMAVSKLVRSELEGVL